MCVSSMEKNNNRKENSHGAPKKSLLRQNTSATGTRTPVSCVRGKYDNHLHHGGVNDAPAENRTRGETMATFHFTTKPLVRESRTDSLKSRTLIFARTNQHNTIIQTQKQSHQADHSDIATTIYTHTTSDILSH